MEALPLRTLGRSAALVVGTGVAWAAFCLWLAHDGHGPSRALLPIPRVAYYRAQAAFVVPLLLLQWAVCTYVATRVGRALGGVGDSRRVAEALSFALCAPLLLTFLLPDVVTYATFGFPKLAAVTRGTGPICFAFALLLATRSLSSLLALSRRRALAAAFAGLLAQALVAGPLLR